jgi:hypothetical protein
LITSLDTERHVLGRVHALPAMSFWSLSFDYVKLSTGLIHSLIRVNKFILLLCKLIQSFIERNPDIEVVVYLAKTRCLAKIRRLGPLSAVDAKWSLLQNTHVMHTYVGTHGSWHVSLDSKLTSSSFDSSMPCHPLLIECQYPALSAVKSHIPSWILFAFNYLLMLPNFPR